MKQKLISLLTTVAIITSFIEIYPPASATANAASVSIQLGDYMQLGTYDTNGDGTAEPILWRCVAFEKITGYDENGAPIIDSTQSSTTY